MTQATETYEIVTESRPGSGIWEADTIGDNEPRTLEDCQRDIAAFRRGECGPDFQEDGYYIRHIESGRIVEKPEDRD